MVHKFHFGKPYPLRYAARRFSRMCAYSLDKCQLSEPSLLASKHFLRESKGCSILLTFSGHPSAVPIRRRSSPKEIPHMKKYLLPLAVVVFAISACQFSVGTTPTIEGKSVSSSENGPLVGAIIKNDIELEAENVKVAEAYLMTPDLQFKENNNAEVNETVLLTVKTDTGWVKINGKSCIGVSERITDFEGKIIVDAADIFAEYDAEGMPAELAKLVNVSALLNAKYPDGNNDFDVNFKIWDKKGPGVIKGKYTLHIN